MSFETLKDFQPLDEFHRNKFSVRQGITELVSKDDLKQEAIKWVKELRKPVIHLGHPKGNYFLLKNNNEKEAKAQIRILEHFFNIEESELR